MKKPSTSGFSLIEIALALAITSFCLLAILGLFSVSFRAGQQASEYTTMAGAANWIISKAQADAGFPLPATLFFDAWGQKTDKADSAAFACLVSKTAISDQEMPEISSTLSRLKMEFWPATLSVPPLKNPNIIYATLQ